jgi:GDPmannose 4,6-dehydratase
MQEFLEVAASKLDLDWKQYVKFDPRFLRPSEVPHLEGNSNKIRKELGWEPKVSFDELVQMMVDYDLKLAEEEVIRKELIEKTGYGGKRIV